MTAEIAVMNKEAIALAADSAVTSRRGSGQKIFTSANKIFALSKYVPVAIMVFGSAHFMNVPWETIIKMYRRKLGKKQFATLKEHATDFLSSLERDAAALFPDEQQSVYVEWAIYYYFDLLREQIRERVAKVIEEKGEIAEGETKEIASQVIKNHHDRWQKAEKLKSLPDDFATQVIEGYKNLIHQVRDKVFEKLPLGDEGLRLLVQPTKGDVTPKLYHSPRSPPDVAYTTPAYSFLPIPHAWGSMPLELSPATLGQAMQQPSDAPRRASL